MAKFSNITKLFAVTVGVLFLSLAIPFICANAHQASADHGPIDGVAADHSAHINTISCCTDNTHSEMHALSSVVSNFKIPAPNLTFTPAPVFLSRINLFNDSPEIVLHTPLVDRYLSTRLPLLC